MGVDRPPRPAQARVLIRAPSHRAQKTRQIRRVNTLALYNSNQQGPASPAPRANGGQPVSRGTTNGPTCARRAFRAVQGVRAAQPLGRAQRAPEARREVARGPARQGQDGRRPTLRRRPPPRHTLQVPRAWQLPPVHNLELFSWLRPGTPLRWAAASRVGGHLGCVTWPERLADARGPALAVAPWLSHFPVGRVFPPLHSSPFLAATLGRLGKARVIAEAAPTFPPAGRTCFREFTLAFLPLKEGAPSPAWNTAPVTLVFFATLVPLF